ncbi:hypothetical protein L0P88_22545 [Muricauda sp. SCSIO 64092]|uniref:hypothetical protein n=1 Tax=Allomuricauda sp. SCSIO 64092 TaxID=2908842 RepID=UPI001FF421DD|nr:hypothetical protein [Muricauda sp. SCSIO 64092]UOY06688.1 hypothetical protein L0P88_22545 [Muricauda sp. SCSIO 64092]
MKRILKILGIGLGSVILIGLIFGIIAHEALPEGRTGPEADRLAQKMLDALNHEKYSQTRYLEWSYQGGRNQYKWDKELGLCQVKWDDHEVDLNLSKPNESKVIKKGEPLPKDEGKAIVEKALTYFNNDSFWLVAPYKVFDAGTTRSIVVLEDGTEGLLITYNSGGTTPGDSYLWELNPNGFPNSYKMWVKIIPIGGLEASWDDWMEVESGAFLPKSHKLGPITLSMGDVKGYN